MSYKFKTFLGDLYFKLTGKTCKFSPNADLNYLLDQIIKRK